MAVALELLGVLLALKLVGEEEEGRTEDEEGCDEPETEEKQEHVALVATLSADSLEQDEELVLVSGNVFHKV